MGCCDSRPLQEKLLSQKEKVFQFEKVSTPQIKAFFKTNEDSPFLTYSIIIENLKNMGITYTESDELIYIKPFFSLFKKESIKVDCTEEYDIRLLISIMILMSNSRENEKALEIFEIYDIGNNNSFSPYELNFMLKSLLNTIDELKLILNGEKFTKTPMLEKIKNEIFEKILKKTENFCFDEGLISSLSSDVFVSKLIDSKRRLNYNYLSTTGIRMILQEWFNFKESLNNNNIFKRC